MWSTALDAIFTALRYLAPATLLTLFWGQQSFLFRILKHIDLAIRTIFSSNHQKESVLKWLEQAGPVRVEHLDTVWRHGWILCGVLDTAMPGACAGHPPIRMSLQHAQTIADHYLGVDPVFTREELDTNNCLSRHQEWKLAHYLDRIREALTKIPPPVSKPTSQRTSSERSNFTTDYVARGGGLTAAQVNNKMFFKVYPTNQQSLEPGDITVLIKGPKDTYGMIVIPPILGKAQLIRQKMLNLNKERQYTETSLPITQGATYLRNFGKNDLTKAYFIPKTKYDIEIEVEKMPDHAKIGYVVNLEGKYEISISSRGQFIVGSPFIITASQNIIGTFETDNFSLEDGEEIDIVDVDGDKKIVLRIVDFVTEKILLNDAGPVDQITTNDSVNATVNKHVTTQTKADFHEHIKLYDTADKLKDRFNKHKLRKTAMKVRAMTRACKVFQSHLAESKLKAKNKDMKSNTNTKLGIPDVVNSTFSDSYFNNYNESEENNTFIKSNHNNKQEFLHQSREIRDSAVFSSFDERESFPSATNNTILSTSNPFLNETKEHSIFPEKDSDLHFTTNNYVDDYDDDETDDALIKIMIDKEDTPPNVSPNTNPFIDVDITERPKTPVLKIITGALKDRGDSVYIDPNMDRITDDIFENNEFINPFFTHQQSQENVTDFIIGAPVSLPPVVKAPTPEPEMDSIMLTCEQHLYSVEVKTDDNPATDFSTPMHTKLERSMPSSTFHSLDSNLNTVDNVSSASLNNNNIRELTPKRDTWDSAYVSIDETNSSPDSNNNDNMYDKLSVSSEINLKPEDFSNLGPAEIETWESCNELNDVIPNLNEDVRTTKWEFKRPIFTPIIEESDRSMSAGLKDLHEMERLPSEEDPVTVAFAELNDVFQEYLSPSEQSSLNTFHDDMSMISTETNYNVVKSDDCVDSASEHASDVMRQTNKNLKGTISEVQLNVTESISVSQSLKANIDNTKAKIHFGDDPLTNIVLEKKQFWDEKIRQIEEINSEQRQKELSSKHLRHNDSLTRSREKQLVKTYKVSDKTLENYKNKSPVENKSPASEELDITDEMHADGKLVQNWKKYWDQRLEEQEETQLTCFRSKSRERIHTPSPVKFETIKENQTDKPVSESKVKTVPAPLKQEVPEEIMFKAFEESPKRFFGTSRKQILNKIDAFLGKPSTVDVSSPTEESGSKQERGIVSNRINLFKSLSHVDEVPWQNNKSCSMQNILLRSKTEKSIEKSFQDEITDLSAIGKVQSFIDLSSSKIDFNESSTNTKNQERKEDPAKIMFAMNTNQIENSVLCNNISIKEKNTEVSKSVKQASKESKSLQKEKELSFPKQNLVKKTIGQINRQSSLGYQPSKTSVLEKSLVSKSEMDIFSKISTTEDNDDLEKYKSYDELPKINVKNFICLYETELKKTQCEPKRVHTSRILSRTNSATSEKLLQPFSSLSGAETKVEGSSNNGRKKESHIDDGPPKAPQRRRRSKTSSQESLDMKQSIDSLDNTIPTLVCKDIKVEEEKSFLSFSDIDVEIIDKTPDLIKEPAVEVDYDIDYKSRFKRAKQYFKSLEELGPEEKKLKVNECEELLMKSKEVSVTSTCSEPQVESNDKQAQSNESLQNESPNKKNIKANSVPSTEPSKILDQIPDNEPNKLVKISEKFNVDDLFNDVTEGKLSRQGSLRGIPNKKAVLETFKSMENVSDNKLSPYEIAVKQLTEFAKENQIKNAQTYLTEYPFLPTTDPSKYHSRLDTKASGLISMKELQDSRPRRNSVPELVVNPRFTVDL